MRKVFICLLILVLCAWFQFAYGAAGDVASIGGKAITAIASVDGKANAEIASFLGKPVSDGDVGASCQATPFLDTFNTDTSKINGTSATTIHFVGAAGYTPAANKTVCKAEMKLDCKYTACSTTTYYFAIYDKSGTALNNVVGEVSNGVTGDNGWSAATVTWTFPGVSYPQITTSGTYGLTYYSSPAGDGAGTSMTMFYTTTAGENGGYGQWATDKSRTDYGSNGVQVRLYAYE